MLVEQKSKQTVLKDKPEPMSLPINGWLKGNDIKTGSTTGSNYWAVYVCGAKMKNKPPEMTNVNQCNYPLMTYLSPE